MATHRRQRPHNAHRDRTVRLALELAAGTDGGGARHGGSRRVSRPTLTTERLILRPFALDDAAEVTRLVSDRRIADTTLNIPHPYDEATATAWIDTHEEVAERDGGLTLAVTDGPTGQIFGAVGLS